MVGPSLWDKLLLVGAAALCRYAVDAAHALSTCRAAALVDFFLPRIFADFKAVLGSLAFALLRGKSLYIEAVSKTLLSMSAMSF